MSLNTLKTVQVHGGMETQAKKAEEAMGAEKMEMERRKL